MPKLEFNLHHMLHFNIRSSMKNKPLYAHMVELLLDCVKLGDMLTMSIRQIQHNTTWLS